MSCGSLSAVTTANTSSCYTSVLTIPAVQALNGTNITCTDGTTGTVVGNDTVKITGELRVRMFQFFSSNHRSRKYKNRSACGMMRNCVKIHVVIFFLPN